MDRSLTPKIMSIKTYMHDGKAKYYFNSMSDITVAIPHLFSITQESEVHNILEKNIHVMYQK